MTNWSNFKVPPQHSPEGSEENHECWDSWYPGWGFNPAPPEYEAGVLTTRPRRSAMEVVTFTLRPPLPKEKTSEPNGE
jgi:hypothetical protein